MRDRDTTVKLPFLGRRTRIATRLAKGLLFVLLTALSFSAALPVHGPQASASPAATSTTADAGAPAGLGSGFPQGVGAYPLPDLSLPKTVLSSVDSLTGAGGVIQASSQNLTLYNYAVRLRLLGGLMPHDQLLGPGNRVLSHWSFWGVEANMSGLWMPLVPVSNNFTIIGTNTTGTFVIRTMQVNAGQYSGVLRVVYKATSAGPLKWDLQFTAGATGQYRLAYSWWNITSGFNLSSSLKQFRASYRTINYTMSWNDVPESLNTTATVSPSLFSLSINLGPLAGGSKLSIDPTIANNVHPSSTSAYQLERKVFYEASAQYYWAFFFDGSTVRYKYSKDGVTWNYPSDTNGYMPAAWPPYYGAEISSPSVYASGRTVVVASGDCTDCHLGATSIPSGQSVAVWVFYSIGTIYGPSISWSPVYNYNYPMYCLNSGLSCTINSLGSRLVSVAMLPNGRLTFSYNWYVTYGNWANCGGSSFSDSEMMVIFNDFQYRFDGVASCSTSNTVLFPSAVLPSDSQGSIRFLYAYNDGLNHAQLKMGSISSSIEYPKIVEPSMLDLTNQAGVYDSSFSAVPDSDYGTHVVYRGSSGWNLTYAYRSAFSSNWTYYRNIISSPQLLVYPTLTVDYSTNDVYALAIEGSSIVMKRKTLAQGWSDQSPVFPVKDRPSPRGLVSNFASASATNSSSISIIWTETAGTGSYNLAFASIPIQTVWSPYAFPDDPWDGSGLAPYGQYFANLGEYVSPSTGMLAVRQTDLSVPGRGLDLEITRVYTEPYSFFSGAPYNYEKYPWAPLGDGWQLNLPWMNNTQHPLYIHLWDGQGYRIPSSFWNTKPSSFENHQGEHFRMVQNAAGVFLYTRSGVAYVFNSTSLNQLTKVIDPLGNNITFSYDSNNRISCITDTVQRSFLFSYNNGLLMSVKQTTGPCTGGGLLVRQLQYAYTGSSLANVTDPAGRKTRYQYQAVSDPNVAPWLLSRITYPTGWFTSFSYTLFLIAIQATSYRVYRQTVNSTLTMNPGIRWFQYSYVQGPGDQVTNSFVLTYDGSSSLWYLPVSNTTYAFSYAGVSWNITGGNHNFVRGYEQRFGVHGEVPREIVLVSTSLGYTSYYGYDLWGNRIYSRRVINPNANLYHESFNAYYNNGLQPGFSAFQETFSQGNYTVPDNPWSSYNGTWLVKNGVYSGASPVSNPPRTDFFAWADIGKGDLSLQTVLNPTKPMSYTDQRVGIFTHYSGSNVYKWGLVIHNRGSTMYLELLDELNQWLGDFQPSAKVSCPLTTGIWYNFTMTIHGYQAYGWAGPLGQAQCYVSGTFSANSPATSGTGFGLYAGGYSTLFDNVTVTTVSPYITTTSFSSFFIPNGAPGPNVHGVPAGGAELQNGTASAPTETYYSYWPWGELNQTRQMYNSPNGTQWLSTSRWYDNYGNPARVVDGRGNYTYYTHSGKYQNAYLTNQTQILKPSGTQITRLYSYNFTMGSLLSAVDPNGYNTTYQYDILGRTTRVNYPYSMGYVAYTYNDTVNYVDITNEKGWKTRQVYDGLGRLSTLERFSSGKWYSSETYTYNWQNMKVSQTDPLGHVYTYQYDLLGRIIKTIKPDGNATITSYDDTLSYAGYLDENGYLVKYYIYDRTGRLVEVIELSPSVYYTYYKYDEVGNLLQVKTSISQITTYTYDNLNRLTRTNYPDGTVESYSYDSNGNMVVKTDRKGVRTSYAYDSLNRVTTITYYGSNGSLLTSDNYTYDGNSNLVQLTSQNATLGYRYDSRNRVTCETYSVNGGVVGGPCGSGGGGGSVAEGTLITLANRTAVPVQNLQPGMKLLSYNVTTSQYATAAITSIVTVVTTNMLVIRTADPLPLRVDNATAQKLWVLKSDGSVGWFSVTQLRPGDYLFNAIDQHWTMVTGIDKAPSGIHVMYDIYTTAPSTYIANNYLDPPKSPSLSTSSGIQGGGYSVSYFYNGEVLSYMTQNDFLPVSYAYDSLGRIVNVMLGPLNGSNASFVYFQNDQVKSIRYGNGLNVTYSYDVVSRPRNITLYNIATKKVYLSLIYSYNKTGTVASVTGQVNGVSLTENYRYDPLQRLTNSTLTSGSGRTMSTTSLWYEYDGLGNRLRQGLYTTAANKWTVTSYGYNRANNELVNATSNGATTRYSYDPNGNLYAQNTTTVQWRYAWDVPGRLLQATNNNGVQGYYGYDGLGRRVEAKEGSSTVFYAYLGTETLLEHTISGDTDYVYANGIRIAKVTGYGGTSPTVVYYHTDALGSTRLVTDSSSKASVVFSDNYQPFGQDNTVSGSETYKFTGKPFSQTTGLYYYYHRWYDPSIGRFISPDPKQGKLSNPQSLNLYIYVLDRPTSLADPKGENWWNPFTWTPQQQAQAFTIAVIAVSIVVIVATAGAGTPLAAAAIGAAIGASTSTAAYTITQGDKASLKGAALSALTGAVAGAIGGGAGGLALNFVKAGGSLAVGMLAAGGGQALGTQVGNFVGDTTSGMTYRANVGQIFTDVSIGAVTFGVGGKLGIGSDAATMAEDRMYSSLGAGQATLDRYLPGSIVQSEITRWTTAITVGQAGYDIGTQAVQSLIDYFTQ